MRRSVQVYVVDLRTEDWRGLDKVLSVEEKARRDKFYFEPDRQAFTVCRAALRQRLGATLDVAPHSLRFQLGPFGKPHLVDENLHFNVSHSQDLALIALCERVCGGGGYRA